MYNLVRYILLLIIFLILTNCNEKISYSGKIFDKENINYEILSNKKEVLNKIGKPNFIDSIENKYYYFSEQKNIQNFFEEKIIYRTMLVFMFNENNSVKSVSQFNLNDQKDIKYIKDKTPYQLKERGLIEKIFGGVGNNLPTTAQ